MKLIMTLLIAASLSPCAAQSLYKCASAQGAVEYRNSPCEQGQKNAGAVKGGAVSSLPATAPAPRAEPTSAMFSLENIGNPIKALRTENAPIDTIGAGECRSAGGYFVQGAGCLDHPPSNRNPSIGETKMREVCKKLAKPYVKALNDCVEQP